MNKSENKIPEYYFDEIVGDKSYLDIKLDDISYIQEHISKNSDSFFFITDFHYHKNANQSLKLINYIKSRTGIVKMFFAGDVGTYSKDPYSEAHLAGQAYDNLQSCVPEFFGVLGNHEWSHDIKRANDDPIQTGTYNENGIDNFYIARHKRTADGMDAVSMCYYVDNKVNKIRYYFIQERSNAVPVDGAIAWLANSLTEIPEGYSVALVTHNAYMPPSVGYYHYDKQRWITLNYLAVKSQADILNAFHNHETITLYDVTYDYTQKNGKSIGIFCGHHHQGILCAKGSSYISLVKSGDDINVVRDENNNPVWLTYDGVSIFQGSVDSLLNTNYGIDTMPWFWEGFEVTVDENKEVVLNGRKIKREKGTVYEQCFYVVQIDLDARKVYITAIGGDHDWEFEF